MSQPSMHATDRGPSPHRLDGRVLLHVKAVDDAPLTEVSPTDGGVVFSGPLAAEHARLRLGGDDSAGPVLLDPAAYERHIAAPERPFILGRPSLFNDDALDEDLDRSLEQGSTLPVTPTAYLRTGDTDSLREAAERVAALGRRDVLFAVPIDGGWLRAPYHHDLISLLRQVDVPIALILGSGRDPLASREAAVHLREVITALPGVGLLRTDLAALDAMVHGAGFAAIGDTASVRHARPPRPGTGGGAPPRSSPAVLVPDLLGYRDGESFAAALDEVAPPRCSCRACLPWAGDHAPGSKGRALTTFLTELDVRSAHAHNMAVWSAWWAWLSSAPDAADARRRWQDRCRTAVRVHHQVNDLIRSPGRRFRLSPALHVWAGLPDAPVSDASE